MNPENFHHFGHKHPITAIAAKKGCVNNCNVCELNIQPKTPFHGCSICNYYLHDHCINISRSVIHPSHPTHPLTLLPASNYPSGAFTCNACGEPGNGVSYSCTYCEFDLHVKCAKLSEKVKVRKIHKHDLILQYYFVSYKNNFRENTDSNYLPLQKNKVFQCNICKGDIRNTTWRYDCRGCDFYAHVGCVFVKGDGTVVSKCGKSELLFNGGESRGTAVVCILPPVPPKSGGELVKNGQEVNLDRFVDEMMKFIATSIPNQIKTEQQPIFINNFTVNQQHITNNGKTESDISLRRLCLSFLTTVIPLIIGAF